MLPSKARSMRLHQICTDSETRDCASLDQYLRRVLGVQLSTLGVPQRTTDLVYRDIKDRLAALIARWQASDRVDPILEIGREEAYAYQPATSPLRVRQLVVLAVRNSLLEDLGSSQSCLDLGSASPLADSDVRSFTAAAIAALSKVNLCSEAKYYSERVVADPFYRLERRYPATWVALGKLSTEHLPFKYPAGPARLVPLQTVSHPTLPPAPAGKLHTVVVSGIDPSFDCGLLDLLGHVQSGKLPFVITDSFKALTRHTEKLFKIIEVAMASDAAILTTNYFIKNGYVSRRSSPMQPAHNITEMTQRLRLPQLTGICATHIEAWRKALSLQE